MTQAYIDLDVRPILRNGGEPFGAIMEAVASLKPEQGLRLYATFKPVPLFHAMATRGFAHEAKEIGGGDWEILFSRESENDSAKAPELSPQPAPDAWPEPSQHLDSRDLEPPEPMVRVLAALETMQEGEVLSALLCRKPIFLIPEIEKRGHVWRGDFEPDGTTYKILICVGGAGPAAA
ncbi:DUF2249 domain-containing protein [Aquamicrobium segne]|uniref:DUF2249 domain-containing protein n=1 Tax=Aquamicrobium segne TaxID=469547 RepID=A0ABW0GV98_9HYPH